MGNKEKIVELLEYVDSYNKPKLIIKSFDDEI